MLDQPNGAGMPVRSHVRFVALFLLATAAFAFSVVAAATTPVAGRTAGSFAVSPSGAATYTIPIWAPPGPHGMQPSIALTYNSQQGNGYVGVGWSVSGLSAIYRCNLTDAQDAAPAPVALATNDGYCMDGQRLRLTSGTYGVAGSTYQTEIANFVNVTAYGSAGSGPSYWVAQDRNGRTYTYGGSVSSQVLATGSSGTAVSWMLNEVSDTYSNTMTISYNTANGTAVPETISWTPSSHGSSSYDYTMTFAYGTNVAPPQGYVGGTSFKNASLLGSISIQYLGTTTKVYGLSYTASGTTGRDTLTEVQECSTWGSSSCLLPTSISYQSGGVGVNTTSPITALSSSGVLLYVNYDFNGDGYKDLVYCNGDTPDIIYVAFGSASGYGTPVSTGIACGALYGDLQGTGTDGILAPYEGTWYYYTWNGTQFTGVSTGLTYDSSAQQYVLADVNGDGLPDLISSYQTSHSGVGGTTYGVNVYTRLNTTSPGAAPSFASGTTLAYTYGPASNFSGAQLQSVQQYGPGKGFDFNGDGRQDLSLEMVLNSSGSYSVNTYELISTGTTFTATPIASQTGSSYVPVYFLDFNNDACTDYATGGVIYISACNGSVATSVNVGSDIIGAMDWNGDGLTDILVQNGSTVGVYESTGTGLSSLITTSIPYSSSNAYLSFDATGDGLDDLGVLAASGAVTYYVHNGAGTPADLVTSITDGYGNSVSATYVSIVQNNYTEHSGTAPTYPYEYYIGPLYVVSTATFSDPSSSTGGTYYKSYQYYAGETNLQGRGFAGFGTVQVWDSRNSLAEDQYFEQTFPYTGMLYKDVLFNSSINLKQSVGTPTYNELSNSTDEQRYFPYFSNWTTEKWELGGTENGDLISTRSTNYSYDSYGNATSITSTVTDNDPGSGWEGDSWTVTTTNTPDATQSTWCSYGLLTGSQVAYSASNGSTPVTITKSLTPDPTHCDYTQIVTQSGTNYQVTEVPGYDSFGNVNSDSVTGVNMTTRTTLTSWTTSSATTGQFPMSVTDPSGAQTQYNYNFSYGLKSSVTDPNNLTTSWQYGDGFGRVTQVTRPDGTYTTWSYANCAGSSNGCLVGANGLNINVNAYASNAALISSSSSYSDMVGRPLVALQMTLSGGYSRSDIRYDSLGRVSQRSFPCAYTSFATTCSYWTTNYYDTLNRLSESQRPISSTNGNLQTTLYAYAGVHTTTTDALQNSRTIMTDVNGWLRQTKDALGYTITRQFDAAGNLTGIVDSNNVRYLTEAYNYGIGAFPSAVTDADMGAWTFTSDALGERTAWTDAKGQSFSESYDSLSRPLARNEPDLFTQWTYGSSASSHNIGKLQSVCTGTGSSPTNCTASPGYSEAETYDSLGRNYQRTITLPGTYGGTFTYTRAYNATTGQLSTLTYPTSTSGYALELQYGYTNGILSTVTDISDTPNVTVWTANTTDPMGHVTEETIGNGIVTNRAFDAVTGWLSSAESGVGGGAGVKNLAFLYDEMGNVSQRQDNNQSLTENIYYDNDYRFSYSKLNGTQNLSVTYATNGNITSRSDVASGASWTYSTTQQFHAVTQAGSSAYQYSYDANGNATSRQGNSITWSSYNYPTTVNAGSGSTAESVSFNYGPSRQRWQQTYAQGSTTEVTDYVGGGLEVVTTVGSGVTDYRHYINAGGGNVAVYSRKSNGTNTFSYMLSDHQASVASITNNTGVQVVGESFDAFGNRRNPGSWSGAPSNTDLTTIASISREGYTFQTALGLWMGMNHMNGRVEDSVTGRMLSADQHVPDMANTQAYNRYSYVYNNPVTLADPSGFAPNLVKCTGANYCAYLGAGYSRPPSRCRRCITSDPMPAPQQPDWGGVGGGSDDTTTLSSSSSPGDIDLDASGVSALLDVMTQGTIDAVAGEVLADSDAGLSDEEGGDGSSADDGAPSYSLLPTSASRGPGTSITYTYDDGAQLIAEGGTLAWRANNPGNIVYTSLSASYGAIGSYTNANNTYAIYPDQETGLNALTSLLQTSGYQSKTVDGAIANFAPAFQNNTAAYQNFITNSLGVSGSTPVSSLSPQQMGSMQNMIQTYENSSPGSLSYIFPPGQGPGQWH